MLHISDYMIDVLPMVTVDITLRIEGLPADVAYVRVGKLFIGFNLNTRHVLNIRYYLRPLLPCWMWTGSPISTDLPRMLF